MPSTLQIKKRNPEVGRLLFSRIVAIHENPDLAIAPKVEVLYSFLSKVFVEVTSDEKLHFTTLFARIAYAGHRFEIPKQTQFYLHNFRHRARQRSRNPEDLQLTFQIGLKALAESIRFLFDLPFPDTIKTILPPDGFYQTRPSKIVEFKDQVRVVILSVDRQKDQLIARAEDQGSENICIQYNIADRNANFNESIALLDKVFDLPVVINLLEVEIDKEGVYRPKAFVINPDYLIDVSAIAESFKDFGTEPILFLLKKFLPFQYSAPLMLGNVANFFLDELMNEPETTYPDLVKHIFQLNPIAFATFDDRQIREVLQKAQKHYINLRQMVKQTFPNKKIDPENCFLEPTFYSELYGIQGRLDIFCNNPVVEKESSIVELKSGKVYKPNIYGISTNHFTQTLLYDLIIKSVFQKKLDPANYILYSGAEDKQLRFAPAVKAQQFEALQLRNHLVAIEQQLIKLGEGELDEYSILDKISPARMPHLKGFIQRDLTLFEKVFQEMSPIERKYFVAFTSFIAKEHQLAKTGIHGNDRRNGQAALWLSTYEEKQNNYEVLSHLEILDNQSRQDNPVIIFQRTADTSELANFRQGDITVLYPQNAAVPTPLQNQLFKCTIIAITKTKVEVRLRSRQFNHSIFKQFQYWNLEHDLLDSGFTGMYRNLFRFAQFDSRHKALMLGAISPAAPIQRTINAPDKLTEKQQRIFKKILSSKDYFLLWGPPGTGKTSMMLRYIVDWLLQNTEENLLLLAYTNRAVDEICESIEQIDDNIRQQYLRIGSKYSTAVPFQAQLLQEQIATISNRKSLKALIESKRIFVATVASISGKAELFSLKKFHRVIIDEASQILEPLLVGLLPHFEHCLLIGDHQQLPAVVVQQPEQSTVKDPDLRAIGLTDLRDSLFERLFRRCVDQQWDWAYDRLSQQGRMHEDIMAFPNEKFYNQGLEILPASFDPNQRQTTPISYLSAEGSDALAQLLCQQRILFFPTESDPGSTTNKTNAKEAKLICQIIKSFQQIYQHNQKSFTARSIGIITPYRAQIAQIQKSLEDHQIGTALLTIDTVERYQGGARDIIIISLCTNQLSQLAALVSESGEGVDRKLNVALTRAREQLILVGNPEVLQNNRIYADLIERYQVIR